MAYNKTIWENLPSTNTPLNASNLNKIENQLEFLDRNIIYSMEEVKIGIWTNGKPLYRKILNVELPIYDSTSSYGGLNRYTYATDVAIVTKLYGMIKTPENLSGDSNWLPFPIFDAASGTLVSTINTIDNSANNYYKIAVFNRNASFNGYWGFAIIEYTKTTD